MPYEIIPELDGFTPLLIGKVVSIQVFVREERDSDTLNSTSMKKYVGTLESYMTYKNALTFTIAGMAPVTCVLSLQAFEIYTYKELENDGN